MNEFLYALWREFSTRSMSASGLEIAVFFSLLALFVLALVFANRRRRRRERRQLLEAWRKKWEHYTRRYGISEHEAALLEAMAAYLDEPEKKYVLLVDRHLFNMALRKYTATQSADEELIRSVMSKAGLKPVSEEMRGIAFSRRRGKRISVDIPVKITPPDRRDETLESRLRDLSPRGASADNPEGRFRTGDELLLSFVFRGRSYSGVAAEVVRLSNGRDRLHLNFHHAGKLDG